MKFRHVLCITSAAISMLFVPATQAQDKNFELKISLWAPTTHPLYASMEEWAASVEKASNGTLTSKLYPSQQLGKAFDHYDMARDGIADMTYVSPGYQPGRFPIMAAGDLPFLMTEAEKGSEALDAWYRKYAEKEMKDVKMCVAFVHDPGSFHSRTRKIVVPADIAGLKVRPANATIASLVASLGGTNVQASAIEAREALEKGVADAITFPWGSSVLYGIDQVTKYQMNAPLYVSTFIFAFNKAKYKRMSPAQQKVIDDHCNTEWAGRIGKRWGDFERAGIAKIQAEPDQDVYTLTPEQIDLWRKAAEPLHDSWAKAAAKSGVDPKKVMAELNKTLDEYGVSVK
ncbi:TRAP transporter substrate-binding protein [Alcaligenaceae bacterium CGII-47]|nr:TRAP transporter substrate-binding protein [Alcaligenaceae bacterium CGII-47]